MKDYYIVTVFYPPWHFGPFKSYDAAVEWADPRKGRVYPLWDPKQLDPLRGIEQRLEKGP